MKSYTITVNGTAYEVTVEEGISGTAPKAAAPAPAAPKAAPKAAAPKAAAGGNIKVSAPMRGKILAVKGTVGQVVKRGDVLAVLEAMKMENDIVAPEDGTVATIDVTVGQTVDTGATIATLN